MVLMITHIMLFGLLIGTMTELVKSSTRRARASEAYKTRVTEVGEWLQSRNVSPSMAKKVHVSFYARCLGLLEKWLFCPKLKYSKGTYCMRKEEKVSDLFIVTSAH